METMMSLLRDQRRWELNAVQRQDCRLICFCPEEDGSAHLRVCVFGIVLVVQL